MTPAPSSDQRKRIVSDPDCAWSWAAASSSSRMLIMTTIKSPIDRASRTAGTRTKTGLKICPKTRLKTCLKICWIPRVRLKRGAKSEERESVERHDPRSSILDPRTLIRDRKSAIRSETRRPGLKKPNKKQIVLDWPPTPRGCEWRRSDDGLNLWRCWTEWDNDKAKRIKKSRYAGHLSDDAWRIMKEYDHEAFISIVGERLRRHGGR